MMNEWLDFDGDYLELLRQDKYKYFVLIEEEIVLKLLAFRNLSEAMEVIYKSIAARYFVADDIELDIIAQNTELKAVKVCRPKK